MKTYAFVGSEKNAGKTTSMNFVINRLKNQYTFCLTSIGVNGEKEDLWYGTPKPTITIPENQFFLTHARHLMQSLGQYSIIERFFPHQMGDTYILAKAIQPLTVLLEGPNDKNGLLFFKNYLNLKMEKKFDFLMIDGSVDRQVIGHPLISDSFFLCLSTKTENSIERRKLEGFLKPLLFPLISNSIATFLQNLRLEDAVKALLFNESFPNQSPYFSSVERIYSDLRLFENLHQLKKPCLYLKSTLTTLVLKKIPPQIKIILDNFTLYQCDEITAKDLKRIFLLNPIKVEKVFLKEESFNTHNLPLPAQLSICNLFREDLDEISISL